MGLFGALGKLLRKGSAPKDAADEAEVDVPAWQQRIFSAQKLAEEEWPTWMQLEQAIDGLYPSIVPPGEGETQSADPYANRGRSGDQLDVNLLGRAKNYLISLAFDRFPSLRFSRRPSSDVDVVTSMERLVEKLMDEGDAVYECKRAMELSLSRGQSIVWPRFIRDRVQESEIVAAKMPPGQFVESVMRGAPVNIPVGADYAGISRAASGPLSPMMPDGVTENATFYSLTEKQRSDLTLLQMKAQTMDRKSRAAPHPIQLRAKLTYECTPYGTYCLMDSSVTDFSKVTWIARKIVMTREEFKADPTFTEEAKKFLCPNAVISRDGGVPPGPVSSSTSPQPYASLTGSTSGTDEWGRIVLWEIWDKIGWRRIYIAPGYGKAVGVTTRYPYMDLFGRPLFPDFFPCVVRMPWSRMRETPARVLGLPGLEPMWAPTMEAIKSVSAFVIGAKSTARIFVVGDEVDGASLTSVARSQDCTYVKLTSNATVDAKKDPAKQFSQVPMSPVPIDYLNAYEKCKREAFESVGITSASMTSTPQADTASQENLIAQGASVTQGSMVGCFEDGYAELAWKSLLLFLEFANPQEFEAYLGKEALEKRPPLQAAAAGAAPAGAPPEAQEPPEGGETGGEPQGGAPTTTGSTSVPMPVQMRPSIYEAMTETDLVGERLVCRFASSTRAEDALRLKTLMDILAIVTKVRDGAGLPYVDPKDIIKVILKAADVEAGDYKPTEAEIAVAVMAQLANRQVGGGGEGGDKSGRKANGERGEADVPGRQGRDQGIHGDAHAQGVHARRATALA